MNEQNNTTCAICGKGYYLCLSCKQSKTLTPWKLHTDTSEHFKIYQILHGHSTGIYNDKESYERLSNVDLSGLENFEPSVKNHINRIFDMNKDIKPNIINNKNVLDEINVDKIGTYNINKKNRKKYK